MPPHGRSGRKGPSTSTRSTSSTERPSGDRRRLSSLTPSAADTTSSPSCRWSRSRGRERPRPRAGEPRRVRAGRGRSARGGPCARTAGGPAAARRPRHRVGADHEGAGGGGARDEPFMAVLGPPAFYRRFGFMPAAENGIDSRYADAGPAFQVRPRGGGAPLTAGRRGLSANVRGRLVAAARSAAVPASPRSAAVPASPGPLLSPPPPPPPPGPLLSDSLGSGVSPSSSSDALGCGVRDGAVGMVVGLGDGMADGLGDGTADGGGVSDGEGLRSDHHRRRWRGADVARGLVPQGRRGPGPDDGHDDGRPPSRAHGPDRAKSRRVAPSELRQPRDGSGSASMRGVDPAGEVERRLATAPRSA